MIYLGAQMELEELPQLKSSSNIPVDHIRTEKTHLEGLQSRPEQKFVFFRTNSVLYTIQLVKSSVYAYSNFIGLSWDVSVLLV